MGTGVEPGYIQTGNSARFWAHFEDWDGVAADPDSVTFRLYDERWNVIHEALLGPANRTGTGEYFFVYTLPAEGYYYWEFDGQLQGYPSLKRDVVKVQKV